MKKINYNLNWEFTKTGTENWVNVTLPHDAMLLEQRIPTCKNGHNTGFFPGGKYTYKKYIKSTDIRGNKEVILEFEGIYRYSEVFINGKKAGGHNYGYTNYYVDITDFLEPGMDNELLVTVDNSQEPNSRWYSGSGIYRPVNLFVGDTTYIKPNGVKITAETEDVTVQVDYISKNECQLKAEIFYKGQLIAHSESNNEGTINIHIDDAKKWSAESPELYTCRVTLMENGKDADIHEETFGIRKITYDAVTGFRINGQETKLRGACIHHDNGILGAAAYKDAEERKIRILKEAGFNAIRSSHNPLSKDMLNACDSLGMYVMDETFDQWYIPKTQYDYASCFEENWQEDTSAMVDKDYNHPSVVMYSIGNEVSETAQERGIELTGLQTEKIHSLDSTRPVTCGINLFLNGFVKMGKGIYSQEDTKKKKKSGPKNKKKKATGSEFINIFMSAIGSFMNNFGRLSFVDKATRDAFSKLDICGYNYGYGRYKMEKRKHPERIIVGSETFPPDLAKNWEKVKELPYLIGDFIWTGWDYIGEAGLGCVTYPDQDTDGGLQKKYPWLLCGSGVIDITGYRSAQSKYNQVIWGQIDYPVIAVQPLQYYPDKPKKSMWRTSDAIESWAWDNCEGKKANIEIYSSVYKVELLLNGKSIGEKRTGKKSSYKAVFKNVPYESGNITAIAKDKKGNELSRRQLHSAKEKTVLIAEAEKTLLNANCQDLAYINIAFADEQGIVKVLKNDEIKIKVEGAGELIGFGSANPFTEEGFLANTHKPYYGRAQAIIRAGIAPGKITVKISAVGCTEISIILEATN